MKIALVTYGLRPQSPGGVTVGIVRILKMFDLVNDVTVDIFNFADNIKNQFSGFENLKEVQPGIFISSFGKYRVYNITSSFALLECMRYRTRPQLRDLFAKHDLIVVRTGLLQFANVLPILEQRVVVIVSTRLKWERRSQYKSMSILKKNVLKIQRPVFYFQERKVLNSVKDFSVENIKMQKWLSKNSKVPPKIWYPISEPDFTSKRVDTSSRRNSHFISVGRLDEPRKGWSRLMLAYKAAFDADRTLPQLEILGWGEFNQKDAKTFNSLRESYPIKVLSNLSHDDKTLHLSRASFFLQTSFEEGLGYVGIEALSLGIPLVCSETFGSREYVVPEENGYLIKQGRGFTGRFAESILSTRTVNYEAMSKCALTIFEQRFTFEKSKLDFFKIFPELNTGQKA